MSSGQHKFFHTVDRQGHVDQQGMVLRRDDGKITVQLFSWLTGLPNGTQEFNESETQQWLFYCSEYAWRRAGDKVFS